MWTLWDYSFPTSTSANESQGQSKVQLREESFALALLVLRELQEWRTSPAFGVMLKSDIAKLTSRNKRKEYSSHFKKTAGQIRMLAWPVLIYPELALQPTWFRRLRQYEATWRQYLRQYEGSCMPMFLDKMHVTEPGVPSLKTGVAEQGVWV